MAVTYVQRRDANFAIAGTSSTSASVAWATGHLFTLVIATKIASGDPTVPASVAGPSMTFTRIPSLDLSCTDNTTNDQQFSVWGALGNGATEIVTVTFNESQTDGFWCCEEWSAASNFNNVAGSFRQAILAPNNLNQANTGTLLNLGTLRDANSFACCAVILVQNSGVTATTWGGSVGMQGGHNAPTTMAFSVARKANDPAARLELTNGAMNWSGIAYELLEPTASGGPGPAAYPPPAPSFTSASAFPATPSLNFPATPGFNV